MSESIRTRFGNALWAVCCRSVDRFESLRRTLGRAPVQTIDTESLRVALERGDDRLLLIDVRTPAERAVSVIPRSIDLESFEAMRREDPARISDRRIVTYCTVGGRSYFAAWRFQREGLNTFNYAGSILGWIHARLPLKTQDGRPTNAVHPYWMLMPVPTEYRATKTADVDAKE